METTYTLMAIAAFSTVISLTVILLNRRQMTQRRLRNGYQAVDLGLAPDSSGTRLPPAEHGYPPAMERAVGLAPDEWLKDHLVKEIHQSIIARESGMRAPEDQIAGRINERIKAIRERVDEIESRYPEEDSLERMVSVNEALLSERIDQISIQVQAFENKVLSRWDVALIVSTVLTGVLSIAGGTYAVLSGLNLLTTG